MSDTGNGSIVHSIENPSQNSKLTAAQNGGAPTTTEDNPTPNVGLTLPLTLGILIPCFFVALFVVWLRRSKAEPGTRRRKRGRRAHRESDDEDWDADPASEARRERDEYTNFADDGAPYSPYRFASDTDGYAAEQWTGDVGQRPWIQHHGGGPPPLNAVVPFVDSRPPSGPNDYISGTYRIRLVPPQDDVQRSGFRAPTFRPTTNNDNSLYQNGGTRVIGSDNGRRGGSRRGGGDVDPRYTPPASEAGTDAR